MVFPGGIMFELEMRFTLDQENRAPTPKDRPHGGGAWTHFIQHATKFLQREGRKPLKESNVYFAKLVNEIKRGERNQILLSDYPPGFTDFPESYSEHL